jgi:hypothetical protein
MAINQILPSPCLGVFVGAIPLAGRAAGVQTRPPVEQGTPLDHARHVRESVGDG